MKIKKYLEHLSIMKGYPSYSEWYDWVCRDGETPVVVAMQIEEMNRSAFTMFISDMRAIVYSGSSLEEIENLLVTFNKSL